MIDKKKLLFSSKKIVIIFVVLCIVSKITNVYLQANYKESFKKGELVLEEGRSQLFLTEDNEYYYRIIESNNTIEISSYIGQEKQVVYVPSVINGLKVECISDAAFAYHSEIERIVIPNTVRRIKMAAFGSCPKLESVEFLGDIEILDEYVFLEFSAVVVADRNTNVYKYAIENDVKVKATE